MTACGCRHMSWLIIGVVLLAISPAGYVPLEAQSKAQPKDQRTREPVQPLKPAQPSQPTQAPASQTKGGGPPSPNPPQDSDSKIKPSDILTLIGTLVGALVGGLIGWGAAVKAAEKSDMLSQEREKAAEQALRKSIRAMLFAEIEQNLQTLSDVKEIAKSQPTDRGSHEWAALTPTPNWSMIVWRAAILHVADTLNEQGQMRAHYIYTQLESFSAARAELKAVWNSERNTPFNTFPAYKRADDLMESILGMGNPLARIG